MERDTARIHVSALVAALLLGWWWGARDLRRAARIRGRRAAPIRDRAILFIGLGSILPAALLATTSVLGFAGYSEARWTEPTPIDESEDIIEGLEGPHREVAFRHLEARADGLTSRARERAFALLHRGWGPGDDRMRARLALALAKREPVAVTAKGLRPVWAHMRSWDHDVWFALDAFLARSDEEDARRLVLVPQDDNGLEPSFGYLHPTLEARAALAERVDTASKVLALASTGLDAGGGAMRDLVGRFEAAGVEPGILSPYVAGQTSAEGP